MGSEIAFGSLAATDVLGTATVLCSPNYQPKSGTTQGYFCAASGIWNSTVDAQCEPGRKEIVFINYPAIHLLTNCKFQYLALTWVVW